MEAKPIKSKTNDCGTAPVNLIGYNYYTYNTIHCHMIMLENWNQSSFCVLQVLINVEEEHEGGEESTS